MKMKKVKERRRKSNTLKLEKYNYGFFENFPNHKIQGFFSA